ncbi:MAG: hypothetical protein LUH63_02640 [Parabacteroides sp.]|nr:hypothetical protein [Parabacteroides sp.]
MMEKGTADMQHNLEILTSDLKGSNCLTPRRTVQTVSNTINIRLLKIEKSNPVFPPERDQSFAESI